MGIPYTTFGRRAYEIPHLVRRPNSPGRGGPKVEAAYVRGTLFARRRKVMEARSNTSTEGSTVDEKRRAKLMARLLGKPGSKAEKEQRVLDLLEWSLADFVPSDVESIAELRAGILLREPDTWPAHIQASTHNLELPRFHGRLVSGVDGV